MPKNKSTIDLAIEHAPKVLPPYLASVIVGMLKAPAPIPVLQEHRDQIALDVLNIALAKVEE